jgi:hypothetical protein
VFCAWHAEARRNKPSAPRTTAVSRSRAWLAGNPAQGRRRATEELPPVAAGWCEKLADVRFGEGFKVQNLLRGALVEVRAVPTAIPLRCARSRGRNRGHRGVRAAGRPERTPLPCPRRWHHRCRMPCRDRSRRSSRHSISSRESLRRGGVALYRPANARSGVRARRVRVQSAWFGPFIGCKEATQRVIFRASKRFRRVLIRSRSS